MGVRLPLPAPMKRPSLSGDGLFILVEDGSRTGCDNGKTLWTASRMHPSTLFIGEMCYTAV